MRSAKRCIIISSSSVHNHCTIPYGSENIKLILQISQIIRLIISWNTQLKCLEKKNDLGYMRMVPYHKKLWPFDTSLFFWRSWWMWNSGHWVRVEMVSERVETVTGCLCEGGEGDWQRHETGLVSERVRG